MNRVYLAGGMKSNWQDRVIDEVEGCIFLDPREHGLVGASAYTLWDLWAIRDCNIVFAYLEKSNPGGYALALEIGYAKAFGKTIILVDEKSTSDEQLQHYLEMVHTVVDKLEDNFEAGLIYLKSIV